MFPLFDENEPGQGIAWVTLALIAINVAVFLFLLVEELWVFEELGERLAVEVQF